MRPNQKRSRGLSPLVIRSLGVLAITLMAMTTAPASGISVPECSECPQTAAAQCVPRSCKGLTGAQCLGRAVPGKCMRCYVYQCTKWRCPTEDGGPDDGQRADCVLKGDLTPW